MEEIRNKTEATLAPLRVRSCCCGITDVETGSRYIAIGSIVLYILSIVAYIADGKPGPAVFSGIYLGLAVMLYVAVTKKRLKLTIAWLVVNLILLVANLIGVIGVLATRADGALFRVTFYVLNTILSFYFWMVIFSFYMELKEEKIASRSKTDTTQEA